MRISTTIVMLIGYSLADSNQDAANFLNGFIQPFSKNTVDTEGIAKIEGIGPEVFLSLDFALKTAQQDRTIAGELQAIQMVGVTMSQLAMDIELQEVLAED